MSYVIQTKNFSYDMYKESVCTKADLVFCSTFEEAKKIAVGYVCEEMKKQMYDYPDIKATVYTDEGKEMYYVFGKYNNTENSLNEIYEEFKYIDEAGHEDRRTNLIAKIVDDGERKIVFANEDEQEVVNDYYEDDFVDI